MCRRFEYTSTLHCPSLLKEVINGDVDIGLYYYYHYYYVKVMFAQSYSENANENNML